MQLKSMVCMVCIVTGRLTVIDNIRWVEDLYFCAGWDLHWIENKFKSSCRKMYCMKSKFKISWKLSISRSKSTFLGPKVHFLERKNTEILPSVHGTKTQMLHGKLLMQVHLWRIQNSEFKISKYSFQTWEIIWVLGKLTGIAALWVVIKFSDVKLILSVKYM